MSYTKKKIPDTREEWLKDRLAGIGGSDAGALMGVSKYKSPYTLWAEKSGLIVSDVKDNEAMRQGRDFEDYVARRFCEQEGKKVRKSSFSFQSVEHPWMLANIDRLVVGENAGLECKTANLYAEELYQSGGIPMPYYCQCLHYMAVMGFDRMYLACLVYGRNFFVFTIDRSDPQVQADIKALIESEEDFWRHVEKGAPVPVDGSESTADTLIRLREDRGNRIELTDSVFEQIENLKKQQKDLKALQTELENQIKAELNDCAADYGFSESWQVTWRKQKSNRIDTAKLRKEFPSIANQYTKQSESHVMRISKRKDK